MTTQTDGVKHLEPLDPNSVEGKRVAAALSKTCADIERNIAARKAVEQRSTA